MQLLSTMKTYLLSFMLHSLKPVCGPRLKFLKSLAWQWIGSKTGSWPVGTQRQVDRMVRLRSEALSYPPWELDPQIRTKRWCLSGDRDPGDCVNQWDSKCTFDRWPRNLFSATGGKRHVKDIYLDIRVPVDFWHPNALSWDIK